MVAALSTGAASGAGGCRAWVTPSGAQAVGGRGVFILLDKVCVQFLHPPLTQFLHPFPPPYIVTDVTAARVDWRVDTP